MRKLGIALSIAGLALALTLGVASCGRSSDGKEGGTLSVSFASFPDALDPQFSYALEGWSAMYNTYIPLLTFAHADGEEGSKVVPGLAQNLPTITDGGKTYTLTLRKGLKYSDGTPVKASDFPASVERMFRVNSSGTPYYTIIVGAEEFQKKKSGGISGIETDDKTGKITIHLIDPVGLLPGPAGAAVRRPRAGRLAPGNGDQGPAAGDRPLRDHRASSRGKAGATSATRNGRRPTRR